MYGTCKVCGCTDNDCSQCIEKTGIPCSWDDENHDLCTACKRIKVYGLQTNFKSYFALEEPVFIVFPEFDDLVEHLKSEIDNACPGTEFAFRIQVKELTEKELNNLPEAEI